MLQNLEQKGYIVRVASTEDARLKKDPVDGESDRASQSDRRADPDFNRELENSITERREADILNYFR